MPTSLERHDEAQVVPPQTAVETAAPRDAFGRTLEQAQQEDHSWREDYLTRVRAQVDRLNRLEGRTGVAGVAVSVTLLIAACAAGMFLDPARNPGWTLERGMQVFNGLICGTVGTCVLGIAGIGLWGWLQQWVRYQNRKIGIELDETPPDTEEAGCHPPPVDPTPAFLDCSECGVSVPVQMPACRLCGARPRRSRTTQESYNELWLDRTNRTPTLSRFVRDATSSPLDVLGFVVLAVMIVAGIVGWFL